MLSFFQESKTLMSATCYTCRTALSGNWSMESNPQNASYSTCPNGRYLGIANGYFLYYGDPNWVYSYCNNCWIAEIQKLNITSNADKSKMDSYITNINNLQNQNNDLKNKVNVLETECGTIPSLNTNITNLQNQNNELKNKINELEAKCNTQKSTIDSLTNDKNNLENDKNNLENEKNQLNNKINEWKEKWNGIDFELITMKKIYEDIGFSQLLEQLNSFSTADSEQYKLLIEKETIHRNLLSEFKKVGTQIFKELTGKFSVKLNDQLANLQKKYDVCKSRIANTRASLIEDGFPEETMKNSLVPMETYLNELGSYLETLLKTKEKTEKLTLQENS